MNKCSHAVSAGIMCRSCYFDLENENKKLRDEVERLSGKTGFCLQCEELSRVNDRLREALEDISKLHDEGYTLEDVEKRRGFLGWTCCQNLQEIATQALENKK